MPDLTDMTDDERAAYEAEHGPGWLDPEGERIDRENERRARAATRPALAGSGINGRQ